MCLLMRENVNRWISKQGGHISSMTQSAVTIQITPTSVPSPPSWLGEVAVFAQVMAHLGLLKAIQEQVRFARARFGTYDTLDFVVVLLGYALSGERTLQAFYERLLPFADPFMALGCRVMRSQTVRRSRRFSQPWIKRAWRPCARSFSPISCPPPLALLPPRGRI